MDEEQQQEEEAGAVDLETALDMVGVGRFTFIALGCCGMANAADAVEILGMSLVLPAAEAPLGLTTAGKSALSSCIFLGMLLGGLLWGPMGDLLGRRSALVLSLLLNATFGAASAAARGVGSLVAMRLIAGVGVGGSVPVVFSFLAELLPARARGRFMVALAAHWMVGSLYSAGLGWAIIPTSSHGWRIFLVVAAAPAFVAAVATAGLLPESPRHLLVQGKAAAAEQALRRMARVNRTCLPSDLRLLQHDGVAAAQHTAGAALLPPAAVDGRSSRSWPGVLNGQGSSWKAGAAGSAGRDSTAWRTGSAQTLPRPSKDANAAGAARAPAAWLAAADAGLRSSGRLACQLLRPPLRSRLLPLLVAWVGMCGGWYSLVLWLPEYFKIRGAGEASLYAQTFAVAAANLPGNIASVFMVDLLGRRWTASACLAAAGAAALAFAAAPASSGWSLAAACVFNAISVGGWNALDLLSAEEFPTEVRSTAMGLLGASGRLASFATTFLAGALMEIQVWAPLVVAAALLAAGSAAMLLLPETALQPLDDTIADVALLQQRRVSASSQLSAGGLSTLAARADALRHSALLELQGAVTRVASGQPRSSGGGGAVECMRDAEDGTQQGLLQAHAGGGRWGTPAS